MDTMFSGFDEEVCDLQVRKAIIVGSVGSGKTSMARYVVGEFTSSNDARLSGGSVTKGVKPYRGKYIGTSKEKVQYTLIDSEGYGADNFSTDTLKNQLLNSLKFETELNCVILCASFERFRNGLKEDLSHLLGVVKTLGLDQEHILVVFTHCEIYNDAVKKAYANEFREYYAFNFKDEDCLFCCFPNMSEVNEVYAPLILENVKNSIKDVRNALTKKKAFINVAMKISEIEGPK